MNQKLKFVISDVFAESRYSGNQLATFLDASSLTDEEMQHITREINFSETTFILPGSRKNGGYRVRIFTPGCEVDFAGHPTLGTASVIRNHLLGEPVDQVLLNLNVGPVPVTWQNPKNAGGLLWMKQVEPVFGGQMDAVRMAEVLGIDPDDLDEKWPVESVSTGLAHHIVPLKNKQALKKAKIQPAFYEPLINQTKTKSILIFCPEGYEDEQTLGVRVFDDYYGIPEDPATGSGNGCLAAYLVKHRYFGSHAIDIKVGQGYEIGRPSTLALKASDSQNRIQVQVGGKVVQIAEGFWD
ncbi:PhzF family phenazine biosynthesis protein [bacterium]|nr:PhzF family phenazine biosynthesis protein [bacterium]